MCEECQKIYEGLNPEIEPALDSVIIEFTEILDKIIIRMPEVAELKHVTNDGKEINIEELVASRNDITMEEATHAHQHTQRALVGGLLLGYFFTRFAKTKEASFGAQIQLQENIPIGSYAGIGCRYNANGQKH